MARKKKKIQLPDPMPRLDDMGREVPDPTSLGVSVRVKRIINDTDRMREIIRSEELRRLAMAEGQETFEEADDFDVEDEYDPTSPYELVLDGELDGEPGNQGSPGTQTPTPPEGTPKGTGETKPGSKPGEEAGAGGNGSPAATPPAKSS